MCPEEGTGRQAVQGLAKEVTLTKVRAQLLQEAELGIGLNTFGDRFNFQIMRQVNDCANQWQPIVRRGHAGGERTVDFDGGNGELA